MNADNVALDKPANEAQTVVSSPQLEGAAIAHYIAVGNSHTARRKRRANVSAFIDVFNDLGGWNTAPLTRRLAASNAVRGLVAFLLLSTAHGAGPTTYAPAAVTGASTQGWSMDHVRTHSSGIPALSGSRTSRCIVNGAPSPRSLRPPGPIRTR